MRSALAGLVAATLIGLGIASPGSFTAPQPAAASDPVTPDSPIDHVVIIYQENHSFDDTLGAVCNIRKTPCNGYTGDVRLANGNVVDNTVQPDISPSVEHTVNGQLLAMRNRWNRLEGCEAPRYKCISHVPRRRIPNLTALANRYAVSDASFASNPYASFGMHIALAAGSVGGFTGNNPRRSPATGQAGPGWGCPSRKDTGWRAVRDAAEERVPSCVPDQVGEGPYRESPVPYMPTIMERMEAADKTWHIYQGPPREEPSDGVWAVCTYFYWCNGTRFTLDYNSPSQDFVVSAADGTLPNLSILLPVGRNSQHNRQSMRIGDNYIGRMVEAAMEGPDWRHTAIFIAYDDCGCFYDHVNPPRNLGIRQPVVMVSPWVRRVYTDSKTAVQPYSMLAFVQHNFGLDTLSRAVDRAYDYRRSFDFDKSDRELLAPVKMTTSEIPASELARLKELPNTMDDAW